MEVLWIDLNLGWEVIFGDSVFFKNLLGYYFINVLVFSFSNKLIILKFVFVEVVNMWGLVIYEYYEY